MTTRNRRIAGLTALALGIVAALWLALSPHLTMRELRDAVRERDVASINEHVDYEALRTNVKARIAAKTAAEIASGRMNPFGAAISGALVGPMVDAMVRPEMVAAMMAGESVRGARTPRVTGADAEIRRTALDRFVLGEKERPGGAVFELQGFTWRMTDVEVPDL
jgi:hypothetical protein